MGFLRGVGRFMAGKPVFTDGGSSSSDKATDDSNDGITYTSRGTPVDSRGYKIIPEVRVTHVKPRIRGNKLVVWAHIQNTSDEIIYLDRIYLLDQKYELDWQMKPGAMRQHRIYKGPAPTSQPTSTADIEYRLEPGRDYFKARFQVEFYIEGDYHLPGEFHSDGPVRDI